MVNIEELKEAIGRPWKCHQCKSPVKMVTLAYTNKIQYNCYKCNAHIGETGDGYLEVTPNYVDINIKKIIDLK